MGIKVACPNGHRLVVKDELAGKRGICPKCKASFKIEPIEGAKQDDAAKQPNVKPPAPKQPQAKQPTPAPKPEAAATRSKPTSKPKRPTSSKPPEPKPTPAGQQRTAKPQSTSVTKSKPSGSPKPPALPSGNGAGPGQPAINKIVAEPGDPIAEAPQLAWYVRHPNGSQYGPAKGELMRQWLAEGRVGGDSLAWREDWPEWKRADQVFAQFASEVPVQPSPAPKQKAAGKKAPAVAPTPGNAQAQAAQGDSANEIRTRRGQAYRRKRQKMRLIISGVLLVVVIALGVTLAIVLTR